MLALLLLLSPLLILSPSAAAAAAAAAQETIISSCQGVPLLPQIGTTSFSVFSSVGRPPSATVNETWFYSGPQGKCRKNGFRKKNENHVSFSQGYERFSEIFFLNCTATQTCQEYLMELAPNAKKHTIDKCLHNSARDSPIVKTMPIANIFQRDWTHCAAHSGVVLVNGQASKRFTARVAVEGGLIGHVDYYVGTEGSFKDLAVRHSITVAHTKGEHPYTQTEQKDFWFWKAGAPPANALVLPKDHPPCSPWGFQ
jgi:hypothetical protein